MINISKVKKSLEELSGKETLPEGGPSKIDTYRDITLDAGKDTGYLFYTSDSKGTKFTVSVHINDAGDAVSVHGTLILVSREEQLNKITERYGLQSTDYPVRHLYTDVPLEYLQGAVRSVLNAERDLAIDFEKEMEENREAAKLLKQL